MLDPEEIEKRDQRLKKAIAEGKQCKNKKAYRAYPNAIQAGLNSQKEFGTEFSIYRCNLCSHYHLTSTRITIPVSFLKQCQDRYMISDHMENEKLEILMMHCRKDPVDWEQLATELAELRERQRVEKENRKAIARAKYLRQLRQKQS